MLNKVIDYEIGIDLTSSNKKDIMYLSELFDEYYCFKMRQTLYEYYRNIILDSKKWSIIVFEKAINNWNAYKGFCAETYLENHKIYSAAEIIDSFKGHAKINFKIQEEDVMSLFR